MKLKKNDHRLCFFLSIFILFFIGIQVNKVYANDRVVLSNNALVLKLQQNDQHLDEKKTCLYLSMYWPVFMSPEGEDLGTEQTYDKSEIYIRIKAEGTTYYYYEQENKLAIPIQIDVTDRLLQFPVESSEVEVHDIVKGFCNENNILLSGCQTLLQRAIQTQTLFLWTSVFNDCASVSFDLLSSKNIQLCLRISTQTEKSTSCQLISPLLSFSLSEAQQKAQGNEIHLSAYIKNIEKISNFQEKDYRFISSTPISYPYGLEIIFPRYGQTVHRNFPVRFRLHENEKNHFLMDGKDICASIGYLNYTCISMMKGKESLWLTSKTLNETTTSIQGLIIDQSTSIIDETVSYHHATQMINIQDDPYLMEAYDHLSLVIATGCDQKYYDSKRLHNLIGSIHFWEPNLMIYFYDLGLSKLALEEIKQWKNVEIIHLPFDQLPSHFQPLHETYSFKPYVIHHCLQKHQHVLWMDVNMEIRRPLDEIKSQLYQHGVFYSIQRPKFPSKYHSPSVLKAFQCHAPMDSRLQAMAGLQGYTKDRWAYHNVLLPLLECAMKKECIAPQGTDRSNHRQDQTVLNALLCAYDYQNFNNEKKYWLSSHMDDLVEPLQPTLNEKDFNEMVIYTRREHPIKPYLIHLTKL